MFSMTRQRGFTLLETLIAAVIFAITLSALFVTFRTGVRAWEAGHTASETYQLARGAQDVALRDLQNLFYRTEEDYNLTYRLQMRQIEAFQSQRSEAMALPEDQRATAMQGVNDPRLDAEDLARPVNLRFVGEDGGALDTLSFARRQSAWTPIEELSWGLRRVKYYVKEGTLYREESSPYGLPGGQSLQEVFEEQLSAKLNMDNAGRSQTTVAERDAREKIKEEALAMLPDVPSVTEPLCEGVEIFNLTFGYYKFSQWNEVPNWDSSAFQYRFPEEEMDLTMPMDGNAGSGLPQLGQGGSETAYNPQVFGGNQRVAMINGEAIPFQIRPDDLPGYIAIQVGVRDPKSKGRLHSFTFFVSMSAAQEEVDTSMLDDMTQGGFKLPTLGSRRREARSLSQEGRKGRGRRK